MTRIIFAAVALAFLTVCLQPAAADYDEAPGARWSGWAKACIGIANIGRSKHVSRMCWRAIVDGAIQTRTLFRMPQYRTNTTENIMRARSGPFRSVDPARADRHNDDASVNLQNDTRVSDALIAIEQIHLLG